MILYRKDIYALVFLSLLAAAIIGFRLGALGLIDPDEPFYCLTAKEMLAAGDLSVPILFGRPQFEKPIFFYWVLCFFFKIGGLTEWAARLGPALAGILTVAVTYFWARVLFKPQPVAFLSALVLLLSAKFIVMSRIVLTDIFLCLFVTCSFFCFSLGRANARWRTPAWIFFFFFCGLGTLTKGPLGFLLPFLGIFCFLVIQSETRLLKEMPWTAGSAVFLAVNVWYFYAGWSEGPGFWRHFFLHENLRRFWVAEHGRFDHAWFYPAGLAIGFFPWSVFLPAAMARAWKNAARGGANFRFLAAAFLTGFLFFTLAKSKLLSYVLPLYPVAALGVGAWLWRFSRALDVGFKPKRPLLLASAVFWIGLPAVLGIGIGIHGRREFGMDLFWPLLAVFAVSAPFFGAGIFLMNRRQARAALFCVCAATFLFSSLVFGWLLPSAGAALSSWSIVSSYRKTVPDASPVFASKILFRGVSYYSGRRDLAVFAEAGPRVFYTPPALTFISSAGDFIRLAKNGSPLYGFVRTRELDYLKKLAGGRWRLDVVDRSANRYLVKLDGVS